MSEQTFALLKASKHSTSNFESKNSLTHRSTYNFSTSSLLATAAGQVQVLLDGVDSILDPLDARHLPVDFDGHSEQREEEDGDDEEHQDAKHDLLRHLRVSLAARDSGGGRGLLLVLFLLLL